MKIISFILCWVLFATATYAHEMTPTYPELKPSFTQGVVYARLSIFNRREDAMYYELEVFDDIWQPIPFATKTKIIKVNYLERKYFDIFIRSKDANKLRYICSTSKLKKEDVTSTAIASKICSKVK